MIVSIFSCKLKNHNIKQVQHYCSRQALKNALKKYNLLIENYDIINHCFLKQYPEYLVSLSHTDTIGASFVTNDKRIKSVGIDIESADRVVGENVKKRLLNEEDFIENNIIDLWVKKEAAFKALWPFVQDKNVLNYKDIIINDDFFLFRKEKILKGSINFFRKEINNNKYLLSLAYIKK